MEECSVCIEKYNKSTRAKIRCTCDFEACKDCVKKYLLETTEQPHCMNCKKAWDDNFLVQNINQTFVNGEYKVHHRQIILDKEISKIPEIMPIYTEQKKIYNENSTKLKILNKQIFDIELTISQLDTQLKELKRSKYVSQNICENIKKGEYNIDIKLLEKKKFLMPCTVNDCRGFLSTQYKCEVCETFTCKYCHQPIDDKKTHRCKDEDVASVDQIKKDTRGCPKCGVPIFKISGCDQMWCTECHISFSWKTGKIETGNIHNPHYFDYLKKGKNVRVNEAPICGRLPHFKWKWSQVFKEVEISKLYTVTAELQNYEITHCNREILNSEKIMPETIKYLDKEINKEEYGNILEKMSKRKKKYTDLLHIHQLFVAISSDFFNGIEQKPKEESMLEYYNICKIREYYNNELKKISYNYNIKVRIITCGWTFIPKSVKYGKSDYNPEIVI